LPYTALNQINLKVTDVDLFGLLAVETGSGFLLGAEKERYPQS
jgi:hypothetical protein